MVAADFGVGAADLGASDEAADDGDAADDDDEGVGSEGRSSEEDALDEEMDKQMEDLLGRSGPGPGRTRVKVGGC